MRVLAISGSLRAGSHNALLLRHVAEQAPAGVVVEPWEGLRELPHYDEDLDTDPPPASVAGLRAAVAEADGIIVATPEYNSSIPGALKNALDWASRPRQDAALKGKPVAVVGASTGQFGAVWAQADVRKVLGSAGARVVEGGVAVAKSADAFDEAGVLIHPDLDAQLRGLLDSLVAECELTRATRAGMALAAA